MPQHRGDLHAVRRANAAACREEYFGLKCDQPMPPDAFDWALDAIAPAFPGWAVEPSDPYMKSDRATAKPVTGRFLAACAPRAKRIFMAEDVFEAASRGDPRALFVFWHEFGHLFAQHEGVQYDYENGSRGLYRIGGLGAVEAEANAIAAEFVAPSLGVYMIGDLDEATAIYGVPVDVAAAQKAVGARLVSGKGWAR